MRLKREQSRRSDDAGGRQPDSLSIHRSFLLRLYAGNGIDTAENSGRLEHVVSGEAREFRSVSDLLHSIGQLLHRAEP